MVISVACSQGAFVRELTNLEAYNLIRHKEVLIIDVRTAEEYKAGHIKGALSIPYDQFSENIESIIDYKNKDILIYCRTRNKSDTVIELLTEKDFTKVHIMIEGIATWQYDLVTEL